MMKSTLETLNQWRLDGTAALLWRLLIAGIVFPLFWVLAIAVIVERTTDDRI